MSYTVLVLYSLDNNLQRSRNSNSSSISGCAGDRGLLISIVFLDDAHDLGLDIFTVILLLINTLRQSCDFLVHSRCNGLFGTVIEFSIGIGILCLHFSSISLIFLLSLIAEFALLWI